MFKLQNLVMAPSFSGIVEKVERIVEHCSFQLHYDIL